MERGSLSTHAAAADNEAQSGTGRWRLLCALPFTLIGAFVSLRVLLDHRGPLREPPAWVQAWVADRWEVYLLMAWVCVPMALLAAVRLRARGRAWLASPRGTRSTAALLGATLIFAGLNYAYFARVTRQPNFVQQHDSFHYTLGPKYFAETGYAGLYECVVASAPARHIKNKVRMRDLRSYTNTKVGAGRKGTGGAQACEGRFAPQRWQSFEADLRGTWAHWKGGQRVAKSAVRDNGYNGTPLHAFVMGRWAHAVGPLSIATLARMALVDVWGICALGWALCLAFGWRVGMVTSIFLFVNAADRFDIVGGSPGRYLWMVALGLAVCALARERWVRGGALLTASTALVAMPAIFWLGAMIALVGQRLRAAAPALVRFGLACAASAVLCLGLGAAHGLGLGNYSAWAHNMSMHTKGVIPPGLPPGPVTSTPGFGLGLKFALMSAAPAPTAKGRVGRIERYRSIRGPYIALAGLMSLSAGAIALRMRVAAATVLFGVTVFYAAQGTVGYYFVCASLLPVTLAASWRAGNTPHRLEAVEAVEAHGRSNARGLVAAPWMCAALELALWGINAWALVRLSASHKRLVMYNEHLSTGLGLWLTAALCAFAWMCWPRRARYSPSSSEGASSSVTS